MSAIKLYGYPRTRSLRALWALEEAGADYQYIHVDLHAGEARRPPFIDLNPGGKVPLLVDDGLVLCESAAIVMYLADKFPASRLAPAHGSIARARFNQWSCFALAELEQPLWTIARHSFIYPENRRLPAIIETARWEFARACQVLEQGLKQQPYILGTAFSGADILLAHTLRWAVASQVEIVSPLLQQYLQRITARPALAAALKREQTA